MHKSFASVLLPLLPLCIQADELNLQGATGALTTPSAEVISSGHFELQANTDARQTEAISNFGEARSYLFGVGILPRVELTGRLSSQDVAMPGGDLSINLKASLFQSNNFRVAAGLIDFAGDKRNKTSRYLVGSTSFKMLSGSLGYSDGSSLDGAFGGIAFTPYEFVSLLGDYDGTFISAGARLRLSFSNGIKVSFTAKPYSEGFEKASYALSISRSLDFDGSSSLLPDHLYSRTESLFASSWFADDRHGLRNIQQRSLAAGPDSTLQTGDLVIRAENAAYRIRQADSDRAVCDQIKAPGAADKVVYDQYRYGLPIVSTALDCTQGKALDGTSTWLTQWKDRDAIANDFSRLSAYGAEIRFAPDLRSFAATEVGIFDYSLALFSTARLQLPAGLGAYVTYESPISSSSNFDDPFLFEFYKHRRRIREAQVQWAHHLIPGLFGLHSIGTSSVNAIRYKSQRNDFVYRIGRGSHQLYGSYGRYKPDERNSILPKRKIQFVGYRLFLPQFATSIEADRGEFFYGDKGYRVRANRYFGSTMVTLFLKRADSENQAAGLELSFPLTFKRGLTAGPLTVVGDPRFRFVRGTTFGQSNGFNDLKPLLMVEPEADYNLSTDWLDSDRLFPAQKAELR